MKGVLCRGGGEGERRMGSLSPEMEGVVLLQLMNKLPFGEKTYQTYRSLSAGWWKDTIFLLVLIKKRTERKKCIKPGTRLKYKNIVCTYF